MDTKEFLEGQVEKYKTAHTTKYPEYAAIGDRGEYTTSLARYQTARDILYGFVCGESEIRTHEAFTPTSLAKGRG